jgi:hypothetical protein
MYDLPSPGRQNPCKGFYFFSDDIVNKLSTLLPTSTENMQAPSTHCSPEHVAQDLYRDIDPKIRHQEMMKAKEASCLKDTGRLSEIADVEMEVTASKALADKYRTSPDPSPPPKPIDNWIEMTNEAFPKG